MFDRLISFLQGLGAGSQSPLPEDDPRVAVAALMFHVMDADGERSSTENLMLRNVLRDSYGLEGTQLDAVLKAGEEAERQAVDLYASTSVLKRELSPEQRTQLISLMWEIVHADGEVHEIEDNIVWRIAELLAVDRRERIEARNMVAGRTPLSKALGESDA